MMNYFVEIVICSILTIANVVAPGNENFYEAIVNSDRNTIIKCLKSGKCDVNKRFPQQQGQTALHLTVKHLYLKEIVNILLEAGADVSTVDDNGDTAMHVAARLGRRTCMTALTESPTYKYGIDARNLKGHTPLHEAVFARRVYCSRFLLIRGADVNCASYDGTTPLLAAIRLNDVRMVQHLINEAANPEWPPEKPPIIEAASEGNAQIVTILLESLLNAHANMEINVKGTPLYHACLAGQYVVADLLLKRGANVDGIGPVGTCLHVAAGKGDHSITTLLLANGANINALTKEGMTALNLAASAGASRVMEAIIAFGSKLEPDSEGNTCLHLAAKNGHVYACHVIVRNYADKFKTVRNVRGMLPIQSACLGIPTDASDMQKRKLNVVRYLATSFTLNAATDYSGHTILHTAAQAGYAEIVDFLLNHIPVNACAIDGTIPLHLAMDHDEVVRILVAASANVAATNNNFQTPLDILCESSRPLTGKRPNMVTLMRGGAPIHNPRNLLRLFYKPLGEIELQPFSTYFEYALRVYLIINDVDLSTVSHADIDSLRGMLRLYEIHAIDILYIILKAAYPLLNAKNQGDAILHQVETDDFELAHNFKLYENIIKEYSNVSWEGLSFDIVVGDSTVDVYDVIASKAIQMEIKKTARLLALALSPINDAAKEERLFREFMSRKYSANGPSLSYEENFFTANSDAS